MLAAAVPAPQPATPPASPAAPPPLGPSKSMMGPPDPGAAKLIETATPSTPAMAAGESASSRQGNEPAGTETDPSKLAVQRTEFAVDVGGAHSIGGLRALWRGLVKSNGELAALHPIIVVKESRTGLGMQLRLAAGPLQDAAAAAKVCASLLEGGHDCETTVFDGQRLAVAADDATPPAPKPATASKPLPPGRRNGSKRYTVDEPASKPESSSLSALFSGKH